MFHIKKTLRTKNYNRLKAQMNSAQQKILINFIQYEYIEKA